MTGTKVASGSHTEVVTISSSQGESSSSSGDVGVTCDSLVTSPQRPIPDKTGLSDKKLQEEGSRDTFKVAVDLQSSSNNDYV